MNRIILFMLLIACTCYAENIDPYIELKVFFMVQVN